MEGMKVHIKADSMSPKDTRVTDENGENIAYCYGFEVKGNVGEINTAILKIHPMVVDMITDVKEIEVEGHRWQMADDRQPIADDEEINESMYDMVMRWRDGKS